LEWIAAMNHTSVLMRHSLSSLFNMQRLVSLMAALACAILCMSLSASPAQAQSGASQFGVKEYSARAGTSILRDAVISPRLPINKTFSELNTEERSALRSYFPQLDAAFEPPFPLEGLKPAMELIAKMQNKLVDKGKLLILVSVDAAGAVSEAKVVQSPSPEMSKAAAGIMMFTKFKPAQCAGVPCVMDFPFHVDFLDRAP
jgi:outer membrane biosynthesis protein TonB